jgi:hypothetical protein
MRKLWLFSGLIFLFILSACAPALASDQGDSGGAASPQLEASATEDTAANTESAGEDPSPPNTPSPEATKPASAVEPTQEPTNTAPAIEPTLEADTPSERDLELSAEPPPRGAEFEFTTDFSKHSISYGDILSGGPPKDGIPAIDDPKFVSIEEADEWLRDEEPVIFFQVGEDARAYPIQILMWHEIVNDTIGGLPVVVTFCPLCNTAIAFERTLDGETLDFGTTGRLRFSNLIMYDRQSETWWQQASGEAIAGDHTGRQLRFLPAPIIGWDEFKSSHPTGVVLSRDTGYNRSYGNNPYAGYDDVRMSPFLYVGPRTPGELPAMARVLTIDLNEDAVAYPYDILREVLVINDNVGDEPVVLFWQTGAASAFGQTQEALGQEVGSANSFSPILNGDKLTFTTDGERIFDEQTNSMWNVLGQAVEGPLAGSQLEAVVSVNHFWFSWAAFRPETRIFEATN